MPPWCCWNIAGTWEWVLNVYPPSGYGIYEYNRVFIWLQLIDIALIARYAILKRLSPSATVAALINLTSAMNATDSDTNAQLIYSAVNWIKFVYSTTNFYILNLFKQKNAMNLFKHYSEEFSIYIFCIIIAF